MTNGSRRQPLRGDVGVVRGRGRAWLAAGLGLALLGPACAKPKPAPVPQSQDYVFPAPAAGELTARDARELRAAWTDVLAADVRSAEGRIRKLQRRAPGRPSVESVAGYARLRAHDPQQAASAFERALALQPTYVPALVGAGSAALENGDADAALGLYRRAQAAAPADPIVRRRLGALKLQVTDRHVSLAKEAEAAGDLAGARTEYAAALAAAPELSDARLALAEVLLRQSDVAGAEAVLLADPAAERRVRLRLAALLLANGEYARAGEVYEELLAGDPADAEARSGRLAARDAYEAAVMPEEYRRIPGAERVTRADLAALMMVRVKALRRAHASETRVAIDIGSCWAREQIASALALDVMDVYPNHTFQPSAQVRRVDLARAMARVLDRLAWPSAPGPAPVDMTRAHLDYPAVQRVLGAGLMGLTDEGGFEPWRPVSGREALDVVDAVARLIGS